MTARGSACRPVLEVLERFAIGPRCDARDRGIDRQPPERAVLVRLEPDCLYGRSFEIPQMLEIHLDAGRVTVTEPRQDRERVLAPRVDQSVGREPGLLAHLTHRAFGRGLVPAQRARDRLPKST